jgi:DNA modification methylase
LTKKLLGSLELNRIYQRDCLEGMAMIPDKSVDLIVIDPPYNIGKDKRWDKWKSIDDYVSWMTEVFKECERVLKPTGSFYWFHNDMWQIRKLMDVMDAETSFVYKQFIVWNKRFDGAKNKGFLDGFVEVGGLRNFQQMAEYCLFYTFQKEKDVKHAKAIQNYFKNLQQKTDVYWYSKEISDSLVNSGIAKNEKSARVIAKHKLDWGYKQFEFLTKRQYDLWKPILMIDKTYEELSNMIDVAKYTYNHQATHHSIWNYEVSPKQGHITPKPVDLIENILRHSSNEGDVVLDCFMGSGTTAVAASRLNRNFIGFERESEYVQIANQRLEAIQDEIAERRLTE